jgi:phosphoglycolate phosphatase-like HAD superfamily hydrolase
VLFRSQTFDETLNEDLLNRFVQAVKHGLMTCEVAEGLDPLKTQTPNANWLIVSGGDQAELREVFSARGLEKYFQGGIFGSPDTKDIILAREIANGNIHHPAIFIGDSQYDYEASVRAGLDFVFITQWTEFKAWREYFQPYQITHVDSIKNLLFYLSQLSSLQAK